VILIHQRYRQTDGRTDGRTDGQHAISIPRYALVHRAVKIDCSKARAGYDATAAHGKSTACVSTDQSPPFTVATMPVIVLVSRWKTLYFVTLTMQLYVFDVILKSIEMAWCQRTTEQYIDLFTVAIHCVRFSAMDRVTPDLSLHTALRSSLQVA